MKRVICIAAMLTAAGLSACGNADNPAETLADKTYFYEKEGFGGDFTIALNSDGSFQYYEGGLSSYLGTGKWSVSGNILALEETNTPKINKDAPNFVNYFEIDGESLRFIEKDSSNFTYVTVKDSEAFKA